MVNYKLEKNIWSSEIKSFKKLFIFTLDNKSHHVQNYMNVIKDQYDKLHWLGEPVSKSDFDEILIDTNKISNRKDYILGINCFVTSVINEDLRFLLILLFKHSNAYIASLGNGICHKMNYNDTITSRVLKKFTKETEYGLDLKKIETERTIELDLKKISDYFNLQMLEMKKILVEMFGKLMIKYKLMIIDLKDIKEELNYSVLISDNSVLYKGNQITFIFSVVTCKCYLAVKQGAGKLRYLGYFKSDENPKSYEMRSKESQIAFNIPTMKENNVHIKDGIFLDHTFWMREDNCWWTPSISDAMYDNHYKGFCELNESFMPFIESLDVGNTFKLLESVSMVTDLGTMKFYEQNDCFDHLTIYGPENDVTIKIRNGKRSLKMIKEHTMTKYPTISRVSFLSLSYEDVRNYIGRQCNVQFLRQETTHFNEIYEDMRKAFFVDNCDELFTEYKHNPLHFDERRLENWVNKRPDRVEILKILNKFLKWGQMVDSVNSIKSFLKKESLIKDEPINFIQQQKLRIISELSNKFTKMMSNFNEPLMERWERLQNEDVLVGTSVTPAQLASWLRNKEAGKIFVDADGEKFDRQTDDQLFDAHYNFLALLGMPPKLLSFNRGMHELYKVIGKNYSSWNRLQLPTGEYKTKIANTMDAQIIWSKFIRKNRITKNVNDVLYKQNNLIAFIVVGDDATAVFRENVDTTMLYVEAKRRFNMILKINKNPEMTVFCRILIFNNENRLDCAPDLTRMRHRYESCNRLMRDDVVISTRNMSYLTMLGDIDAVRKICEHHKYNLKLQNWYSLPLAIHYGAVFYRISCEDVENNLSTLLDLIKRSKLYTVEKLVWVDR